MSDARNLRATYNVDSSAWDTDTENYIIALEVNAVQNKATIEAQRAALNKKERKYLTIKGDLRARQGDIDRLNIECAALNAEARRLTRELGDTWKRAQAEAEAMAESQIKELTDALSLERDLANPRRNRMTTTGKLMAVGIDGVMVRRTVDTPPAYRILAGKEDTPQYGQRLTRDELIQLHNGIRRLLDEHADADSGLPTFTIHPTATQLKELAEARDDRPKPQPRDVWDHIDQIYGRIAALEARVP